MRVGIGDQGGDAIERGHGVQSLRQQPEPPARHWILAKEAFGAMFDPTSGVDALLREEVAVLRVRSQAPEVVGHGVHQTPLGELPQPVAEGGGGDTAETGQLLHRGQGYGAYQQQRVLKLLGQRAWGRVPSSDWPPDNQFPCGRFDGLGAPANSVNYGAGDRSPHVAPFKEAPESVAGDAQGLGRSLAAMPQYVGPHVAADGVGEVAVRRHHLAQDRRPALRRN